MIEVDGRPRPWRRGLTLAELMTQVDPKAAIAVVRMNDKFVSENGKNRGGLRGQW